MDPQIERYVDSLVAIWQRRGDRPETIAIRRDQVREAVENECRRLEQRGITDDVIAKAIRWHRSSHPIVDLGAATARRVSLQPFHERQLTQGSLAFERLPLRRRSLHQGVVWQSNQRRVEACEDVGVEVAGRDATRLPSRLAEALDWLRHYEGLGNLAGIAAGAIQESNPIAPIESFVRGLGEELETELREWPNAGQGLARRLTRPLFALGELWRMQAATPYQGRRAFATLAAQPLLEITDEIQRAKCAAEAGEPYESSRRVIVATAKTMRLILMLAGSYAALESLPPALERRVAQLRTMGGRLREELRIIRRRLLPNRAEMTEEEFLRWLERQQGSIDLGRRRGRRGINVRNTDDSARALASARPGQAPTATTRPSAAPGQAIAAETTEANRPRRRPAEVESITARGRSRLPRREGRRFVTANLADQYGDRFTWTHESEGSVITEVTMRFEPDHVTRRGRRHRTTQRARQQAATESGEDVVFQAGHVRAAILDGIGEAISTFPQLAAVNGGAWREVEKRVVRLLKSMEAMMRRGELINPHLHMNIKFRYAKLGARVPEDFVVSIRVVGQPTVRLRVTNNPIELRVAQSPRTGYRIEQWDLRAHPREDYGKEGIERLRRASTRARE